MANLLKSLPARCWFISLGLFLATLTAAHFFPSEILTAFAKLAALPLMISLNALAIWLRRRFETRW